MHENNLTILHFISEWNKNQHAKYSLKKQNTTFRSIVFQPPSEFYVIEVTQIFSLVGLLFTLEKKISSCLTLIRRGFLTLTNLVVVIAIKNLDLSEDFLFLIPRLRMLSSHWNFLIITEFLRELMKVHCPSKIFFLGLFLLKACNK